MEFGVLRHLQGGREAGRESFRGRTSRLSSNKTHTVSSPTVAAGEQFVSGDLGTNEKGQLIDIKSALSDITAWCCRNNKAERWNKSVEMCKTAAKTTVQKSKEFYEIIEE